MKSTNSKISHKMMIYIVELLELLIQFLKVTFQIIFKGLQKLFTFQLGARYKDTSKAINISIIVLITIGLSAILIANLASNSSDTIIKLIKQSLFGLIGLIFYIGIINSTKKQILIFGWGLFILGFYALIYTKFLTKGVNGAHRWINFGPITIQTSEFFKIGVVIILSHILSRQKIESFKTALKSNQMYEKSEYTYLNLTLLSFLIYFGLAEVVILNLPDLGSTILIFTTSLAILYVAKKSLVKQKQVTWAIVITFILIVALIIFASTTKLLGARSMRFSAFLNPFNNAINLMDTSGDQIRNGMQAIYNGRYIGSQEWLISQVAPESDTDLILAVIGERTGLVGLLAIFSLIYILFVNSIKAAMSTQNNYYQMIIIGSICLIVINYIFNFGGLLSALPLTGVPVPFISYGGSALLSNLIIMGIIQNSIKQINQKKKKEQKEK